MPRIQKDIQARQIRKFQKTNRRFNIVATLNAARLIDPKNYGYENKARLHREITNGCKDALDQIHQLIGRLPKEFRDEILQTKAILSLGSYRVQAIREAKYAGKPFDQGEFDRYTNLLDDSLEAIALMMPSQSERLIKPHIEALRNTLSCFSDFASAYHLEKKIPQFKSQKENKD